MQLNEYQKTIPQFAIYPGAGEGKFPEINYLVHGLVSESGELAGKWKKFIRDGVLDEEGFIAELGDVYWYVTQLCSAANINAEQVLLRNYEKLYNRKATDTIKGSGDKREKAVVTPDCC